MQKFLPEDEKLLLLQIAKGDENAFTKVFHAYRDKLFAFTLTLSGSEQVAEDVVQDVFMKIWVHREELLKIDYFNAYLFRMAKNHTLNLLKRLSKERLILSIKKQDTSSYLSSPESQLTFKNLRSTIQNIINELPPKQKKVYQLKRQQGLKLAEIAKKMHISTSTVKNHLTQALKTIRTKMQHHYPETLTVIMGALMLWML